MKANINWVLPWLATGGDLTHDPTEAMEQIEDIQAQGITHIVDLRSEASDEHIWEIIDPDIVYVHAPTDDKIGHHMAPETFDAVIEAVKSLRTGDKLLVHCHMGINRGPSGAFAALLWVGYRPTVAFDMVRAARGEAAIYYAMDALKAHHERTATREDRAQIEIEDLAKHITSIWTPEEQSRIAHIIRKKHDFDLRSLF